MRKQLEQSFLMGIGLLSMTREKAQEVINELVGYGDATRDEAKGLVEKLAKRGEEEKQAMRKLVREEIQDVLQGTCLATQRDIDALKANIQELTKKLEMLAPEQAEDEAAADAA